MNKQIIIFIACLLTVHLTAEFSFAQNKNEYKLRKSIVKIHTVSSEPYYLSPWKRRGVSSSYGSGAIIKGERILTNAHVVSNQKYLQVQQYGNPKKYNAEVLFVSHEADLAILTVSDKEFFKGVNSLVIGALPETLEEVLVYGYPTGGDSMSITKGILSRVVYDSYVHSGFVFIAGQVDAAINPGNSGGPIIVDGKIAGVVMQGLNGEAVENIGYMIPPEIINHFFEDIKDGSYDGFPAIGFSTQNMESISMRENYKMKKDLTGVLITNVDWNSSAKGSVQKGDVILSIDGHKIANDSTVEFRNDERINFQHFADLKHVGDSISLSILREGTQRKVEYNLKESNDNAMLVPYKKHDVLPEYFIFGGLVFSPLIENVLCAWEDCEAPADLMVEMSARFSKESRQEVIVALQVLPADVNEGYHGLEGWIVQKVNDKEFKDFEEFYLLITRSRDNFIIFENNLGKQIVIDRKKAIESVDAILETYNIKADRHLNF